ncbi:MAG: hypothetical protein LUE99_01005 [Bacteroides sp.]|nr:hypothetical protein [Bacteroides sp.]
MWQARIFLAADAEFSVWQARFFRVADLGLSCCRLEAVLWLTRRRLVADLTRPCRKASEGGGQKH